MQRVLSIGYGLICSIMCLWMIVQSPCFLETVSDLVLVSDDKQNFEKQELQTFRSSCWGLAPVSVQEVLPDLKRELLFLGSNRRPDAVTNTIFLELRSSKSRCTAQIGDKIYLQKQGTSSGSHFIFSTDRSSRFWIECKFAGQDGLEVNVFLKSVDGRIITDPKESSQFRLSPQHGPIQPWEIAGIRVDASFALKQKIRRIGVDKFLYLHGGEEFLDKAQKERVDFVSATGEPYSRYLSSSDVLFWDGDRWQQCGEFIGDSQQAPLLEVKRVDDKIMTLNIWNIEGTAYQTVNLAKNNGSSLDIANVLKELQFVGMRTWTRPILQAGDQRFILNADEWLLRGEHWVQIRSKQQLEDYISGKIQEPLFVFEGVEKGKEGFILKGHLFNAQRTHVESVALVLNQDTCETVGPETAQGIKAYIPTAHVEGNNIQREGSK